MFPKLVKKISKVTKFTFQVIKHQKFLTVLKMNTNITKTIKITKIKTVFNFPEKSSFFPMVCVVIKQILLLLHKKVEQIGNKRMYLFF